MLNKELLLVPSSSKDYTNIITVGAYLNSPSNALGYAEDLYGHLDTTLIMLSGVPYNIKTIITTKYRDSTQLSLKELRVFGDHLYLARKDKRVILTKENASSVDFYNSYINWNIPFITELDFGKPIELWIGDTPPPWA